MRLNIRTITLAAGLALTVPVGAAGTAQASSPVPLAPSAAPADAGLYCGSHIPSEPGFRVSFRKVESSTGAVNEKDAYCSYDGISEGDLGGFPAGVYTRFSTGIDWQQTCTLTTESASGPSTAIKAGDGSWWCLPA